MRSSQTLRVVGLTVRVLATFFALAVLVPLVWLLFVLHALWHAPQMIRSAWEDWRFHARRTPGCGYTLCQALRIQARLWRNRI
jgi:hypothetical protein